MAPVGGMLGEGEFPLNKTILSAYSCAEMIPPLATQSNFTLPSNYC